MKLSTENYIAKKLSENEINIATERHKPETVYKYLFEAYNSILGQKK